MPGNVARITRLKLSAEQIKVVSVYMCALELNKYIQ